MKHKLENLYLKLYGNFGPQHWWPAESPFEVMLGAILTQNTSWQNAEKAIQNLKRQNLLSPKKLRLLSCRRLGCLIRPAGYYNIKARRLKNFLEFFFKHYGCSVKQMKRQDHLRLREELLSVNGIGPETADSILLYALDKPVFVVDAYTRRVFSRHGLIKDTAAYEQVQALFMRNLRQETKLFNEYHALIVKLAKDFCLKAKPKCGLCPIKRRKHA